MNKKSFILPILCATVLLPIGTMKSSYNTELALGVLSVGAIGYGVKLVLDGKKSIDTISEESSFSFLNKVNDIGRRAQKRGRRIEWYEIQERLSNFEDKKKNPFKNKISKKLVNDLFNNGTNLIQKHGTIGPKLKRYGITVTKTRPTRCQNCNNRLLKCDDHFCQNFVIFPMLKYKDEFENNSKEKIIENKKTSKKGFYKGVFGTALCSLGAGGLFCTIYTLMTNIRNK